MPVLLPGKSHGQRSLVGYSPWGRKESDRTEWLHFHHYRNFILSYAVVSLFQIFSTWSIPFSYSCKPGPVVMDSLSFCLGKFFREKPHCLLKLCVVPCLLWCSQAPRAAAPTGSLSCTTNQDCTRELRPDGNWHNSAWLTVTHHSQPGLLGHAACHTLSTAPGYYLNTLGNSLSLHFLKISFAGYSVLGWVFFFFQHSSWPASFCWKIHW